MIGQAILKSVAFTTNTMTLKILKRYIPNGSSISLLIMAATISGFVTSFLTVPFERIKVLMQAQQRQEHQTTDYTTEQQHDNNNNNNINTKRYYKNEIECLYAILRNEGLKGLMLRGLGPTLAREVPSFVIYFVVYALFIKSQIITGKLASLVGGALAGCICWIPVYPIDIVKTIVQNTDGNNKSNNNSNNMGDHDNNNTSTWTIIQQLYQTGGVGAFFDGLTPKLLRAAINHAVTFFLYDTIVQFLTR